METGICPCCLNIVPLEEHHLYPRRHYGKGKQEDLDPEKSPFDYKPAVEHVKNLSNIIETQKFIDWNRHRILGICHDCHVKLEHYIQKWEKSFQNSKFPSDWFYPRIVDEFLRYDLCRILEYY